MVQYKILLIYPRNTSYKKNLRRVTPPLGLAYIAAVLEKEGYEVSILDAALEGYENIEPINEELIVYGLKRNEVKKRIQKFSPNIVGVTFPFSSQCENVLDICKIVKEISKDITVVVGGVHASAIPKETLLKNKEIDYVVIGEGEYTFRELANNLKNTKAVSAIKGIAYRKSSDSIQINSPREHIQDLDSLPFPARHLLDMAKYMKINTWHAPYAKKSKVGSIITSRGCSGTCVFCSSHKVFGHKFRARKVDKIIEEIEFLISEYSIEELQFEDDNLTFDRKRAMELFTKMEKYKLSWCTPNGIRIDRVDNQMLKLMKKSGCYQLTFGIESGNEYVVNKIIRKGINLKQVKPIVREAKRLGILVHLFFMVGIPSETKKQMKDTLRFAKYLNPDSASFSIANPLPGSKLYDICLEKNYLKENFKFEDALYRKANINTPDFSAQELEKFADKMNYNFNLSLIYRNPLRFIKKYKHFMVTSSMSLFKAFRKNA